MYFLFTLDMTISYINKFQRIIVLQILLFVTYLLQSQTIHFSQAYGAHITLNPANTGRFNGDWRAVGMFRNQGVQLADEYQTTYLSFEKPLYFKTEKINAGLFYSRDNSAGSTFPVDRINISASTTIWLTHSSNLSAGLQGAFVNKQIKWDGISFPEQYNRNTGGFDPLMPTGELLESTKTNYLDLGIGLLYSAKMNNSVIGAGYSLQQLNRPKESFFNIENILAMKHIFHGKADIDFKTNLFLIPSFVYIIQGNNNALLTGANLGYKLKEWEDVPNSVIGGVHIRNIAFYKTRSLIISSGFTWQYYTLILSYDTPLANSGSNGFNNSAIEITMGFKLPSTELKHKTIPCERY